MLNPIRTISLHISSRIKCANWKNATQFKNNQQKLTDVMKFNWKIPELFKTIQLKCKFIQSWFPTTLHGCFFFLVFLIFFSCVVYRSLRCACIGGCWCCCCCTLIYTPIPHLPQVSVVQLVFARIVHWYWCGWASLKKSKNELFYRPSICLLARSLGCVCFRCVDLMVCVRGETIFEWNERQRTLPYSIIQPFFESSPWGSDKISHKYHQTSAIFRTLIHRYVWTCDSSCFSLSFCLIQRE